MMEEAQESAVVEPSVEDKAPDEESCAPQHKPDDLPQDKIEETDGNPPKQKCYRNPKKVCLGVSIFLSLGIAAVFVWNRVAYPGFYTPKCAKPKHEIDSLESLNECIQEIHDKYNLEGLSVAITVDDKTTTWNQNYGYAHIDQNRKVTSDTPFLLSSVSKTFIAVAIMQLVEEERLDLDADINLYLTRFQVDNPKVDNEVITLRHLSTHTSGLIDNWDVYEDSYGPGDPSVDLGDFMEGYYVKGGTYYDADLNFKDCLPGDCKYEYSNVASALAAYVVESVTGISYAQYVEDNILTPLNMTNSHYYLANYTDPEATIAMPYETGDNNDELDEYGYYGYPTYPDGRLFTSANDLTKYMRALMGESTSLMSLKTRQDMLTAQEFVNQKTGLANKLFYGQLDQAIFWVGVTDRDVPFNGHDGGDYGSFTLMFMEPKHRIGIVVLANYSSLNGAIALMQIVKQVMVQSSTVAKFMYSWVRSQPERV